LILQVSISEAIRPKGDATFVVTCKECVLAIKSNGPDEIFNPGGADLYASFRQDIFQRLKHRLIITATAADQYFTDMVAVRNEMMQAPVVNWDVRTMSNAKNLASPAYDSGLQIAFQLSRLAQWCSNIR